MNTRILLALGASCGLLTAGQALAVPAPNPATANVNIKLDVVNVCTLNSNNATMDFGQQNAGPAPVGGIDASADIDLTCSGDSPLATIAINGGQNPSGTQRNMKAGSLAVAYDLYSDKFRTATYLLLPGVPKGVDGGNGIKANTKVTVYGRIPANTPIPSSNGTQFTDVVIASIAY